MSGFYSLYKSGSGAIAIYFDNLFLGNATSIDFTGAGQTTTILGTAVTVDIPGGLSAVYTEIPTGLINGVNTTYTVLHTIGTVLTFNINGQYVDPAEYSVVGNTITFGTPLDASLAGTPFYIVYV